MTGEDEEDLEDSVLTLTGLTDGSSCLQLSAASAMDSADGEDDAEDEEANKAAVVVGDSLIKTVNLTSRFSHPHNKVTNN